MNRYLASLGALIALQQGALAQSSFSSVDKFAWSENCGFLNFRDGGCHVSSAFLSGFVWGENIGWINMGSGAGPYANLDGASAGVNLDPGTGALSGLAWGENVGWINFSGGSLASPPSPARLDTAAQRLRGFAWGENIGWINLDDDIHFVALACPADLDDGSGTGNPDGGVDVSDLLFFLAQFEAGAPGADLDNGSGTGAPDGGIDINDLLFFLEHFQAGC